MNATIECLSNIKGLSDNLLKKLDTFDPGKQSLCLAYSNLIYELLHTREKYKNPKLFKDILDKLIKGNQVNDAKDLIIFIIETIHKELLPPSINNENQINFFHFNETMALQNFLKIFSKNITIISNIFYGIMRKTELCTACCKTKFSFQTFNLLNFQLRKIKEYKIEKMVDLNSNLNLDLNLYDAFLCEQEIKILKGQNLNYCYTCNKYTEIYHKQNYYAFPPILIIILNRGKNNQDFNESFRFDEKLDFSNIVQSQHTYKKYFLIGIITQLGKSGSNEHFVAYCRNNINDNFICYNDTFVAQVSVRDAMSEKISEKEDENKIPYILIYHYMK